MLLMQLIRKNLIPRTKVKVAAGLHPFDYIGKEAGITIIELSFCLFLKSISQCQSKASLIWNKGVEGSFYAFDME